VETINFLGGLFNMLIVIILMIGGIALVGLVICVMVVAQLMPRPFVPPYQKIRMLDGRILEGPYKVLGHGSFGTVCRYTLDSKLVAVKIPNSCEYNELQQHELKLLQKANPHPNVIKYIEQVEVSDRLWIVMELMQGSVRDLLDKNPALSWETKLSIAIQMAAGMAHLHNPKSAHFLIKAIVHQDLKPDNLLVDTLSDDPNVKVRISDLGCARQLDQLKLPFFGKIASKLHKGHVGGTLLYAAPEIITAMLAERESCNPKSDVFSAGIILWEIATTNRPNRSVDEIEEGSFEEFNRDKDAGRRRMTNPSFSGSTTEKYIESTYLRASFFGPAIYKCIRREVDDRISARQLFAELKKI
jgi:serine/threonine protein kinase